MTVPYSFSGGTPIESAQVNANFNDLDSRIDTAVNNTGLVYITSKTWTSTSNDQQIDNCFSSTFDNYRLVFRGVGNQATPAAINLQLVDGTTPDTAATYYWLEISAGVTAVLAKYWNGTQASIRVGYVGDASGFFTCDIGSPNLAENTTTMSQGMGNGNVEFFSADAKGLKLTTTQYEGFKLLRATGTWAGTVTVYGYRKA